LAEVEKPFIERDFTSFPAYKSFLEESMASLAANAASQARQFPRRLAAALSSGYDSSTVAAIARKSGLDDVLLFDTDRKEERDFHRACQPSSGASAEDSGKDIAAALGLRPVSVAHDAWMDSPLPEVPFLAADATVKRSSSEAPKIVSREPFFSRASSGTQYGARTRATTTETRLAETTQPVVRLPSIG
jgi:hypothetical protein